MEKSGFDQLVKAFEAWDKRGKGTIRKEDLIRLLDRLGLHGGEADELVEQSAISPSGDVEIVEFLRWLMDRGWKGSGGKTAKVESPNWDQPLDKYITKEQARDFSGDAFDEVLFDRAAKGGEGEVDTVRYLIDMCLIRVATNDDGLLDQPSKPIKRLGLVQIYIDEHEFGGTDKSCNGHRYDSIPFANGAINAGMACYLVHYVHRQHDVFIKVMEHMDAIILRCSPGQIKTDGGDQAKFDKAMRKLTKDKNVPVWPSPDVLELMGSKDALTKIKSLTIGEGSTDTYCDAKSFKAGFKKTIKFQRRVLKSDRSLSGEGVWIIALKKGDYCSRFGEAKANDDEVLTLLEANDNHIEEHTVAEFMEWCTNGRTNKGCKWESKGTGKYFEGGKESHGQMIDQPFCPRILEGALRLNMVSGTCLGVIHKLPACGSVSAVGDGGADYTFHDNATLKKDPLAKIDMGIIYVSKTAGADGNRHRVQKERVGKAGGECEVVTLSIDLPRLVSKFVTEDCPNLMKVVGLKDEPLPLWWSVDFVNASPGNCWESTRPDTEKWIVCGFQCACVPISKCLPAVCAADKPQVSWKDIPETEAEAASTHGNRVGMEAARLLGVDIATSKMANLLGSQEKVLTSEEKMAALLAGK